MATKRIDLTALSNSRTPKTGFMTIGISSGGVNQNAQVTFPALGVTGQINSVRLYYAWDNNAAGEGYTASATHIVTVLGSQRQYAISGASGSSNVLLPNYSNKSSFSVDLRSYSSANSTSKGYYKTPYLIVDYTPSTARVRVGGTWKQTKSAHVKVGGVWREAKAVYVRVGGVWRLTT